MIRFDGARGYAYDGHRGTDFAVPSNTPVLAADEGTVIYSEWRDSGGCEIVIDHAYDRTAYFHNNQLFVYPGQHVSRGQLIAVSGSTGNSTGPHLHFEVRDLLTPWHSIDPYGWTGPGQDPWRWDLGYLWTSNPPVPFLLPLAFVGGAHWNYWYGTDGPPPPVSWRLRDGGRGLGGYAARWDADPGPSAPRTQAFSGTAAVPGPGSHTLHVRVFDRAGSRRWRVSARSIPCRTARCCSAPLHHCVGLAAAERRPGRPRRRWRQPSTSASPSRVRSGCSPTAPPGRSLARLVRDLRSTPRSGC